MSVPYKTIATEYAKIFQDHTNAPLALKTQYDPAKMR